MKTILREIVTSVMTVFARKALKSHTPYIIGITGSVGKTTTKDAIAHVLDGHANVRKSEKSFNSEIGLPLAILGLPNEWKSFSGWCKNFIAAYRITHSEDTFPEVLVLEIGADKPGDIGNAMQWIHPNIGVLTRLPDRPVHVENFPNPESVRLEKMKLIRALSFDGIFVGNGDDERIVQLAKEITQKTFLYGFSESAHVRGSNPHIAKKKDGSGKPLGIAMDVQYGSEKVSVVIEDVLGEHILSAALAAIAVGVAKGISLAESAEKLKSLKTAPGRMRIIDGKNGSIIIDDSYNASPVATHAALRTLSEVEAKHRVAVLGDMLELGKYSEEEHAAVGEYLASCADCLIVVGSRARTIAESALRHGMQKDRVQMFSNSVEAGEALSKVIQDGDVILVKGSQGSGEGMIRMERATKQLMAHPEQAKDLLVRQDDEWQKQYKG